jgi:glutathione S-transferase
MKLYYSPGACSLAIHIALLEADMKADLVKVNLKTHTLDDGRSFRDVNPKGYVPGIELDDGELLTENVAILSYVADRYPALMAPGPFGRYRLLEMLSYIATELHKSFHPLFDPGASAAEKKAAADAVAGRLAFVATQVQGPYLFGANATVADAYLFVMLLWAAKFKIAIPEPLRVLTKHMRSRPTVQAALRREGLIA